MTFRVVQWSTGNVGRHAIAGIDARPDLELSGVWVSNPAKVGKDAGRLAGLGRDLGVTATGDADALLAQRPDCVVYTSMADVRLMEAIDDLCRILRAGVNVVSSSPVFLQFPDGVVPPEMSDPVREAAAAGGASIFVNGIDPGFANDVLPLAVTGISERIEQVRCMEILNYATYDQGTVLFDIMGFGRPLDETPMLLQPGVHGAESAATAAMTGQAPDGPRDGEPSAHNTGAALSHAGDRSRAGPHLAPRIAAAAPSPPQRGTGDPHPPESGEPPWTGGSGTRGESVRLSRPRSGESPP